MQSIIHALTIAIESLQQEAETTQNLPQSSFAGDPLLANQSATPLDNLKTHLPTSPQLPLKDPPDKDRTMAQPALEPTRHTTIEGNHTLWTRYSMSLPLHRRLLWLVPGVADADP
ncbi:hypothetical protein AHAS_Ahas16G0063600 [Arachis hypogaea]